MEKKYMKILLAVIVIILSAMLVIFLKNSQEKVKEKKEKEKQEEIIKNAKVEVTLKEDLKLEFLDKKKVSDFIININGEIVDDYEIDSKELGIQTVSFEFINDEGIKVPYKYQIEVVDTVPPLVMIGSSYKVKKGSSDSFIKNIFCGDNYDSRPICTVEGDYDLDKNGTYPVTFKAVDSSGNVFEKDFKLIVYTPKAGSGSSSNKSTKTSFSSVLKKYKNENTRIGLDVSKWQGNIDFDKLKEAGVEFIIIRVGTKNANDEYVLDPKFIRNITEANRVGIDAGIYFYSYANTREESLEDAEWVLEQIKDYKITMPIAFDWESWSRFNSFKISFYDLTSIADVFLNRLEEEGYTGMVYSSKKFLEMIWLDYRYETWLAHYTANIKQTDYKGKYRMWQLCSDGRVSGINGAVDINVWYLNN